VRIGLLSDSHGRHLMTRAAVSALRDLGAGMLIHLGDVCGERVLDELAGVHSRVVFGNMDLDIPSLARYAESIGVAVDHPMGRLEIDGKRLAYTHGHQGDLMARAVQESVDYLFHGHTHSLRDERIGRTRVINPGALFRAARYTAMVLEPGDGSLEVVDVNA
jgi:putative phosphoesterase